MGSGLSLASNPGFASDEHQLTGTSGKLLKQSPLYTSVVPCKMRFTRGTDLQQACCGGIAWKAAVQDSKSVHTRDSKGNLLAAVHKATQSGLLGLWKRLVG